MYTPANTRYRKLKGRIFQQCVECYENRRNRYRQWDSSELCRARKHARNVENTYIYPDGKHITCKPCRRESTRRRWKHIQDQRVPCMVRGCERSTYRAIPEQRELPYVCPGHRKRPPEVLVKILRRIGRLDLLAA